MKKISPSLFILILALVISLSSCDAGKLNEKAEKMGNTFYTHLQQKKYDSALGLCSDKAFQGNGKEDWTKKLKRNAGLLGNIVSFTKTSAMNIGVSTSTGTTVAVTYDVQWEFGQSKDSVLFVKEQGGEMKIYRYSWQHFNAKYMAGMDESEKQAALYMSALQQGNYPAALDLCASEAFTLTPKEQWLFFYENTAQKWGKMETYKVVSDSSTYAIDAMGQAGEGNYYDVYVDVNRPTGKAKEKLVFFQKKYNEPLKLAGHRFL